MSDGWAGHQGILFGWDGVFASGLDKDRFRNGNHIWGQLVLVDGHRVEFVVDVERGQVVFCFGFEKVGPMEQAA